MSEYEYHNDNYDSDDDDIYEEHEEYCRKACCNICRCCHFFWCFCCIKFREHKKELRERDD